MDKKVLNALVAEHERLLQDLRAVEAVLRREGQLLPKASKDDPIQDDFFDKPPAPKESILNESANGTGGKSGLRQAIADILESSAHGLRPIGVTNGLLAAGFDPGDGKTPLKVRVAGEMSRMKSSGRLRKTRAGLYRVN